jgi:septal ring factor EnvC (AmiA/AmiB activator)
MTRWHGAFLLLLLFGLLSIAGVGMAQAPPDPNSPEERQKRWRRVLFWKQRTRLLQLQKQEGGLLGAIETIDREHLKFANRILELQREAKRLSRKVKESHKQWLIQRKIEAAMRKRVQPRLRLFYRFVRLGKARLLMGSKSLKQLATRWRAMELLTVQDVKMLQLFQAVRIKARELAKRWKKAQQKLHLALQTIKKKQVQLRQEKRAKAMALQSLYREVHVYRKALRDLRNSGHALRSMLNQWQRNAPSGGLALLKGQLPWPIHSFSRYCASYALKKQGSFRALRCQKTSSKPRSLKGKHQRPGATILMPSGTPVLSVAAGKCVHRGWIRGYGQVVLLDHGQKFYSLYAHLSMILIKKGDSIRSQQPIGLTGATGILGKPLLYFELRHHARVLPTQRWLQPTKPQ